MIRMTAEWFTEGGKGIYQFTIFRSFRAHVHDFFNLIVREPLGVSDKQLPQDFWEVGLMRSGDIVPRPGNV